MYTVLRLLRYWDLQCTVFLASYLDSAEMSPTRMILIWWPSKTPCLGVSQTLVIVHFDSIAHTCIDLAGCMVTFVPVQACPVLGMNEDVCSQNGTGLQRPVQLGTNMLIPEDYNNRYTLLITKHSYFLFSARINCHFQHLSACTTDLCMVIETGDQ